MSYPVTPTLSVEAVQVSLICPVAGSVNARLPGALGGWVSPEDGPYTSNSEICPAGQAVLAVMNNRRNRVVVAVRLMVTVLPVAGSKVYPAEPTRSAKLVPSVLPRTARVCVRVPQPDTGTFSTTLVTATDAPRSTCSHCGNALFVLSQYVDWLPSLALPATWFWFEPLA